MNFEKHYFKESVDSPGFKQWFGDSKVVDKHGNPVVVYHGTMGDFDTFDYKYLGTQGRAVGAGFYFTDDENVAKGYSQTRDKQGKVLKVYLRIVNPLDIDEKNFDRDTIEKIVRQIAETESKQNGEEIADGFLSNWGDVRQEGLDNVIDDAVESYSSDDKAADFQGGMVGEGINPRLINDAIYDVTGHDGFIQEGVGEEGRNERYHIYVPFFPNQIKSVDNKTFNLKSDNIHK